MDKNLRDLYNCDVCSWSSNCQYDRVCLNCGKLKKAAEWRLKKSEILCLSCFEKGSYEPLYLIKKKLWSRK